MPRPMTPIPSNVDEIRNSFFSDLYLTQSEDKDARNMIQHRVYHPECPYANKKTGNVLESRYVWWKTNPLDKLTKYDTLTHINGNRRDCRIENLKKEQKRQKYVVDKTCPYSDDVTGRILEEYYVWWKKYPTDAINCGDQIQHINGNKSDNRIENLRKVPKRKPEKIDGF